MTEHVYWRVSEHRCNAILPSRADCPLAAAAMHSWHSSRLPPGPDPEHAFDACRLIAALAQMDEASPRVLAAAKTNQLDWTELRRTLVALADHSGEQQDSASIAVCKEALRWLETAEVVSS